MAVCRCGGSVRQKRVLWAGDAEDKESGRHRAETGQRDGEGEGVVKKKCRGDRLWDNDGHGSGEYGYGGDGDGEHGEKQNSGWRDRGGGAPCIR